MNTASVVSVNRTKEDPMNRKFRKIQYVGQRLKTVLEISNQIMVFYRNSRMS